MDRRGVLSLVGALLAAAAGCSADSRPRASGPRTPPSPGEPPTEGGDGGNTSMRVSDLDVEAADDGHLRVLATVTNPTATERTRSLRVRVTIDETTTERRREVTVPAGEKQEVAVEFGDVAYDDFSGNGTLQSALV
jgi:type 1 fimbria pilin